MRLTKLVPTLGILAATTIPAFGVELLDGKLTLAGYVDTTFEYTRFEKNAPRHGDYNNLDTWNTQYRQTYIPLTVPGLTLGAPATSVSSRTSFFGTNDSSAQAISFVPGLGITIPNLSLTLPITFGLPAKKASLADFSAYAQLDVEWKIGDKVTAKIEVSGDDSGALNLDSAFINWQVTDTFDITMGRYGNWLGWESSDPRFMYRVNNSVMTVLLGNDVTGVRFGFAANENLDLGLHIVDGIYGDPYGLKDGNDLAIGFEATFTVPKVLSVNLDLMYDINATHTKSFYNSALLYSTVIPALVGPLPFDTTALFFAAPEKRADVKGIDVNLTVDALRESAGALFALDVTYVDYRIGDAWGIMGMTNIKLPGTPVPMSVTLMLSHVVPNTESDETLLAIAPGITITDFVVQNGEDLSETEIAVALLTNPTSDDNFGANLEFRYIMREDFKAPTGLLGPIGIDQKKRSEFGVFVELLAILP